MSFRTEDKYILNKIDYLKIRSFLKKNNFANIFPERKIKSIYFDNKFLSMYNDSEEGVVPRKKIRIRNYNDDKLNLFLEIKINSSEGKYKKSKKIKPNLFKKYCKKGKYDSSYGICYPKLYVKYSREYFENNQIRITIDKNIEYENYSGYRYEKENFFIFEIKSSNKKEISNFNYSFPMNKIRFSKYSEAVKKLFGIERNYRTII